MTLQGASIRDAIGAVIPWGLSRIMPYVPGDTVSDDTKSVIFDRLFG